jgi:predicted permease
MNLAISAMTTLLADIRVGLRMLIKTPLLSLIAILTVGLGVGLTTHTFSTVYGTILRGVPVPGEERLMHIDTNRLELGAESMEMSIHDFEDLRAQQTSFEDVAAFYQGNVNLAGEEGPPERFVGAFVSANALSHLGVPPLLGRGFRPGEDEPDASSVIVLGYHVWTNRFVQDPANVGKSIRVNGETTEIIGVMPEGFRFPFREDAWLPHRIDSDALPRGAGQDLDVFGKLRKGVSEEAARAELSTIATRLARDFPETNEGLGTGVRPYEIRFMPAEIRAIMWVMLGATFGVLLIACANVANILLARTSVRSKDVAIRTALGASRAEVVRQLMVESAMLTVAGGILGVVLSAWGVRVFNAALEGIYRPYWIDIRMDMPVLLFSLAVTAAAALAAGMYPAVRASGVKIGEILKDESRGSSGLRLGRFSSGLVVTEIAVSCGLLIGAGFMIKSVINIQNVDLGFESEGLMTGRVSLFETEYPTAESRDQFFDLLKERLEAEPGIVSAALGTHLPSMGSFGWYIAVEGETYPTDRDYPVVRSTSVSTDYFRTAGVDFLQGRDFDPLETRVGGDPVVIVNQSFANRYLPDGDPLGRRIRPGLSASERPWMTIVGVVPDIHVGGGVGGIGDDRIPPERIFVPKGLIDYSSYAMAVRTEGDPAAFSGRLREIVAELDPNLPVYGLLPLNEAIQEAIWAFGLFGSLFTIFGAAALFLAAVGLYGVMAFSVSQRRREMGVRMALGAEDGAIIRLVLGKGAFQLGIGITLGLAVGAGMGQPLRHILYGVETGDPYVYGSVVVTLLAAGLLASFVPARAATRANPVDAMRVG